MTSTAAQAAAPAQRDGLTAATAAASCWEIKQATPASSDGIYWLQTPRLGAPQQFYCDQTTDGGGWVLIGRGREGWSWAHQGQGTPAQVRSTPSGTGAFEPAAVSADTVDGLLNGGRVDALNDGVRVRRATDTAGTTWQELRLRYSTRDTWSWAIGGGNRLSAVVLDGTTFSGALNTQSWSRDTAFQRFTTNEALNHNYQMGWAYGSQVSGVNNATSYLWTYTTEKSALPFAQMFIRPQLTSAAMNYPAIPQAGLAANELRPLMSSKTSDTTPWGVTGVVGGGTGEFNMEVEAFASIGRTMYVGGKFQYVQKGANPGPGEKVQQSYLAAFNEDTGEWQSGFRPVLNGMVWDLQATPDGKLIVGGEFTSVNGTASTSALAALDPATGAVLPNWRADVTYPNTSNLTAQVKAIDYQDGFLYIGGRFTRISGGSPIPGPLTGPVTVGRAGRVSATNGRPDGTWKPNFDGTIVDLDASAQGDRVYFVGYFDNINSVSSPREGAVSTAAGAARITGLQAWQPSIGSSATYQQAIREVGNSVWQGGSEHNFQRYDRSTYALQRANIARQGGDTQAMTAINGVIYMGCHCGNWAYNDSNNWSNPIPTASNVNSIKYIGAYDATTGDYLPDFWPGALDTRSGSGPWEFAEDVNGCMWAGGDFTRGSFQTDHYQWAGGFVKFCPRDTTAPTAPANLQATVSGSSVNLTWDSSTDASGSPRYEVYRDDRIIATVGGRTFTDTTSALPATYWVRAFDNEGNRSATTSGRSVGAPDVQAPSKPANLRTTAVTDVSVSLAWEASTDNTGVTAYRVYRDGVALPVVTNTSLTESGLQPNHSYTYTVEAGDAAGNWSGVGLGLNVTTLPDTTPPAPPTNLQGTAGVSGTQVDLTWTASSPAADVVGYRIVRNGTVLPTLLSSTGYSDTGLTPSTTYSYTVRAYDAFSNYAQSNTVSVSTPAAPNNVFTDNWAQADGSPWSPSWTPSAGSGSVDVQGGRGALSIQDVTGAYARAVLSGVPSKASSEALLSYQLSSTSAVSYFSVFLRGSGGWQNSYRPNSGYGVQISSNTGTVAVQRNVNGTLSPLGTVSGAQQISTAKHWLRFRVEGSQIMFRTWIDGSSEPAAWTFTGTDSALTTEGQMYVSHVRGGANAGARTMFIDDLSLTSIG